MKKNIVILAVAFLSAMAAGVACSNKDAHAAQPTVKSTPPPSQSRPPPPDADATTRKPIEPKVAETPPTAPSPLEAPPSMPPEARPSPSAQPPATAEEERLLTDEEAAIPTQEEADQEAALAIDETNADQELEKLEKELAEGGGG